MVSTTILEAPTLPKSHFFRVYKADDAGDIRIEIRKRKFIGSTAVFTKWACRGDVSRNFAPYAIKRFMCVLADRLNDTIITDGCAGDYPPKRIIG